jgi:uncharacterized SAM-binding protein YcdF (DUF218 family)
MASSRSAFSSRVTRRLVLSALVVLLCIGLFLSLGWFVVSVDDPQPADVIFVLAGSRINRALEAVDLYRRGLAPRIVMSGGSRESGERDLERQGIHVASEVENARRLLVTRLGVPEDAITILPEEVDNTAQEAEAIRKHAVEAGWTKLIVVAGCASTRRAGYALRRVFDKSVTVIVRCNPHEMFAPARWWAARWSFRATFYEAPKLIAYWLGLRG